MKSGEIEKISPDKQTSRGERTRRGQFWMYHSIYIITVTNSTKFDLLRKEIVQTKNNLNESNFGFTTWVNKYTKLALIPSERNPLYSRSIHAISSLFNQSINRVWSFFSPHQAHVFFRFFSFLFRHHLARILMWAAAAAGAILDRKFSKSFCLFLLLSSCYY